MFIKTWDDKIINTNNVVYFEEVATDEESYAIQATMIDGTKVNVMGHFSKDNDEGRTAIWDVIKSERLDMADLSNGL